MQSSRGQILITQSHSSKTITYNKSCVLYAHPCYCPTTACVGVGGVPDDRYAHVHVRSTTVEKSHGFFLPFMFSQGPTWLHNLAKKVNYMVPASCCELDLKEPLSSSHTYKLQKKEKKKKEKDIGNKTIKPHLSLLG